jgi:8-oxo-dGTP pyrophosphatase MutT (NUDIX family)
VKRALALGIAFEVVIPCSQYADIYDSAEIREEYHDLLGRCQQVHELPFQECSEDAYLAAGHWIVDHTDLMILVWNGYPAGGKGGTADIASYSRLVRCPFIHINPRLHIVKRFGSFGGSSRTPRSSARREYAIEHETVYQGQVLTVSHYRLQMPDGKLVERDIVERPESVLVLPVGQQQNVMLIEEYDLGAGIWQLTLPGGKVVDSTSEGILKQAQVELREETGFCAGRFEKLIDLYSHPGYIAHKVHLLVAYDLEWDPLEMDDGCIRLRLRMLWPRQRKIIGVILKLHWLSGCMVEQRYKVAVSSFCYFLLRSLNLARKHPSLGSQSTLFSLWKNSHSTCVFLTFWLNPWSYCV